MIDTNNTSPINRSQPPERTPTTPLQASVVAIAAVTPEPTSAPVDTHVVTTGTSSPSALTQVNLVESPPTDLEPQSIRFNPSPEDRARELANTWAKQMMDRPRHEVRMMLNFLAQHQDTPLARIPKDERNFLDAIPAELRSQLPLLGEQLKTQDTALELRLYAQRQAEPVREALESLRHIARTSYMDTEQQASYVQAELARMQPEARQIITSLGLHQPSQLATVGDLNETLSDLRMDLEKMRSIERFQTMPLVTMSDDITAKPLSAEELAANNQINRERVLQKQSDVLIDMTLRNVNHTAAFNSVSGLEGFMLKAKELSPGSEKVLAQVLAIRDAIQNGDETRVKELKATLDITDGHDALIFQLLNNASNVAEIEQLPALLKRIEQNGATGLGNADFTLLRKFGLSVDDKNQLVNLANGSVLKNEDIPQLLALAEYTKISMSSMEVRDYTLGTVTGIIENFATQTGLIAELQTGMTQRAKEMEDLRQGLLANTQLTSEQTGIVDRLSIEVENIAQEVGVFSDAIRPFQRPGGGISIPPSASRYDLGNLNTALKPFGLSVTIDKGQVSFQHQGRVISETSFVSKVEQGMQSLEGRLSSALQKLDEARKKLADLRTQGAEIDNKLAGLETQQTQDLNTFRNMIAQLDLAGMEAKRNDPTFWNSLSDQEKQLLEQALITARQQKRGAPEFEAKIAHHLDQVAASRKAHHQADQKAAHSLKQADKTLEKANTAKQELQTQRTGIQEQAAKLRAQLAEESAALIAKAEKLENTLNLAPRPVTISVGVLVRDWIDSLSRYQDLAHKAQMQTLADQTIARTHAQQQQERLKENISYHLKQLQQLDGRQEARTEQVLRESLAATAQGVQAVLASVKPTEQP
jgi:hypothetical protein